MEDSTLPKDYKDQLCKICGDNSRRYTCPRCGIGYCSVNCYRSMAHSECCESFYKQCVMEEFNVREQDTEAKRTMLDILKRMHNQTLKESISEDIAEASKSTEDVDSDDEEEVPDLEERLANVNLDDADAIWSVLTNAEKQEFEAVVRNREEEKLIPRWVPWWSYHVNKKFIQELDEERQDLDYVNNCPQIMEVSTSIDVSAASPCVRFNLPNVLYAYAYLVLYHNGDHRDFAKEATSMFLQLCDNMRQNRIFHDSAAPIDSVVQRAIECQWLLPTDEQTVSQLKEAGDSIVRGPDETNRCFYMSAALSDLHRLLASVVRERSTPKSSARNEITSREFSKRFTNKNEILDNIDISKRDLRLYLKKLEYYLAWIRSHGDSVYT